MVLAAFISFYWIKTKKNIQIPWMAILFAVDMCTRVEIYVITTYDSHKVLPKLYIINSTLNDWIIHREYTENGFETNKHTKKETHIMKKGKKSKWTKKYKSSKTTTTAKYKSKYSELEEEKSKTKTHISIERKRQSVHRRNQNNSTRCIHAHDCVWIHFSHHKYTLCSN